MQTIAIKLKDGQTREVKAYGCGVLAIHKSINPFEKSLWKLTHKPTSAALATGKTRKELMLIAKNVGVYAEEHLDKWTENDPLEIFIGNDGNSHRDAIRKICGRA